MTNKEFEDLVETNNIDCGCLSKMRCAFDQNKKWIDKNNPSLPYNVGLTRFSVMDRNDFVTMNKLKCPPNIGSNARNPPKSSRYPIALDWTKQDKKYVSPVSEQGKCGACWAFTATGVIESAIAIKKKEDVVNLSEQHLLECMPASYYNLKCDGGVVSYTLKYIKDTKRVCLDDIYKYVSGTDCKNDNCPIGKCVDKEMINVDMKYECTKGEDNLIAQLQKGPVTSIMNSTPIGLQNYQNGIFDGDNLPIAPTHGVLVVGYGEENGKKFWKIKNTWGNKWGENGYFRIKRGDGNGVGLLGIANENCSVTIQPDSSDFGGWIRKWMKKRI